MNTTTPEAPKRGRPAIGDKAMTAAERQKAYRERLKEERYDKAAEVSRVTLMQQLAAALHGIETHEDADLKEGAQYHAAQIIAELTKRYDLKPRRKA